MPDEPEVEVIPPDRGDGSDDASLKSLLRENNALLRKYGPAIKRFVEMAERGEFRRPPTSLAGVAGEALRRGHFDGILEAIAGAVGVADEGEERRPRRRRRD